MTIELSDNHIQTDLDLILWKYLDLWKFESLLKENAIFFCRIDKFPDDPFEGSTPAKVKEKRFKDIMALELFYGNSNISKMHNQNEMISSFQKNVLRKRTVVNCWHISKDECNLMWNSYLANIEKGIVIKTNLTKLIKSFEQTPESIKCWLTHYLDYEKEDWLRNYNSFDLFAPFIHKKSGFIKENELRLIYQFSIFEGRKLDEFWNQQLPIDGILLKLNLNILIEEIYCSPKSNYNQIGEINKFISDCGFTFKAKESSLSKNSNPLF